MSETQDRAAQILRGFITGATTPGGHILVFRGTPGVLEDLAVEAAAWQLLDAAGVADVMLVANCEQCGRTVGGGVKYRDISEGAPFSWDTLRDVMTPGGATFEGAWDNHYDHELLCSELTEQAGEAPGLDEGARLRIADWFAAALRAVPPTPQAAPPLTMNVRAVRRLAQALIDELPDDTAEVK